VIHPQWTVSKTLPAPITSLTQEKEAFLAEEAKEDADRGGLLVADNYVIHEEECRARLTMRP